MRLRQIEVFRAVYLEGSINGAARTLNVSQPSVSKVLHSAEDFIGFRLFNLSRGRLVPTEEAHLLYREVNEVFERVESLRRTTQRIKSGGNTHLRVGVVPSLGLSVAPQAIAEFRRRHPDVTFEVQTLHHDELLKSLHERKCDIVLSFNPPEHARLRRILISKAEVGLFYPSGGPETFGRLPLADLKDRVLTGLAIGGPVGDLFGHTLRQHQITIIEVISTQTFFVAAALAKAAAGAAIIDEFTAAASIDASTRFSKFAPPIIFDVACVHLEDRPLSLPLQRLVKVFSTILAAARIASPGDGAIELR